MAHESRAVEQGQSIPPEPDFGTAEARVLSPAPGVVALVSLVLSLVVMAISDGLFVRFVNFSTITDRAGYLVLGYVGGFLLYALALAMAAVYLLGRLRRASGWVLLVAVVVAPFAYFLVVRGLLA